MAKVKVTKNNAIKVEALEKGFYGNEIRKEGDVFHLKAIEVLNDKDKVDEAESKVATEKQFSKRWMKKV